MTSQPHESLGLSRNSSVLKSNSGENAKLIGHLRKALSPEVMSSMLAVNSSVDAADSSVAEAVSSAMAVIDPRS